MNPKHVVVHDLRFVVVQEKVYICSETDTRVCRKDTESNVHARIAHRLVIPVFARTWIWLDDDSMNELDACHSHEPQSFDVI